ncbi:MAG: hypothetical protein GSR83_04025 [Desulfurococcales archaeon]|nr:hypothetical protein [Desulfurococcales archaeon]
MKNARRYAPVLIALLLVASASIAMAAVFIYYPLQINVNPSRPPIIFSPGSNAGQNDLWGQPISLSLGANQTSATITVHPTYRVSYYENITIINNTDSSNTYDLYIKVVNPVTVGSGGLPSGSEVKLCLYSQGATRDLTGYPKPEPRSGTYIACVDLTSTGLTHIGQISGGSTLEGDLYYYIPEGYKLPSSLSADLHLIYTPESGETPP